MRAITAGPIITFILLLLVALAVALSITWIVLIPIPLGHSEDIVYTGAFVLFLFLALVCENRLFLWIWPLKEGEILEGSKDEFIYHINLLFYLLFFYSITRSKITPVPIMRLIYMMLGAKFGRNTYSSGTILDPSLTVLGDNTIIGQDCVLYSHAIEGRQLSLAVIHLGNNVTVGANSVVMSGVKAGDEAIIAAGSVVTKGTTIGTGEVWGGVPARKIRGAGGNPL